MDMAVQGMAGVRPAELQPRWGDILGYSVARLMVCSFALATLLYAGKGETSDPLQEKAQGLMATYGLSPNGAPKVGTLVLEPKRPNFHSIVSASKAIGLDPSRCSGKKVTTYSYTLSPPCSDVFVHFLFYQGALAGAFAYPMGLVGGVLPLTGTQKYCRDSEPAERGTRRSFQ